MSKLSCSFTLGKMSSGNANIEHNNREFISSNVDPARVADNIVYVREDVRDVYDELFGEALEQYNAKQKRNDRKIHDYYEHILQGNREEAYYEIIVQFGDSDTAKNGTSDGRFAVELLDEYAKSFQQRNPNLRVINQIMHNDESSPHLHINFVPFYNEQKKIGMSKGVSMKAALIEQGYIPQGMKQNQLVMWEQSEMAVMEDILNSRGIERDVKKAKHMHQSVPDYKASQDWKKLPKRKKNMSTLEVYHESLQQSQAENSLLKVENEKLIEKQNSPWKSFYFSNPDKHIYVQNRLAELGIPYRENEQGFEAQQCHVERIRQIEKQYKSTPTSHRDILRDTLDKITMQVKSYGEIFTALKKHGYSVKCGKYMAVRPIDSDRFIRIKSLGEMYSENALRNRIDNRNSYEDIINHKMSAIENKQSIEFRYQATVNQYILTFRAGRLPMKKVRQSQPFSWINDAELDRLASLNKKLNDGISLTSLRRDFGQSEKKIADIESRLTPWQKDLKLFSDLQISSGLIFEKNERNPAARKFLADNGITAENYKRLSTDIKEIKSVIYDLEQSLTVERNALDETVETLSALEKIANMTYVDSLVQAELNNRSSEFTNGVKSSEMSLAESLRVDSIAERTAEVIEGQQQRSYCKL